MGKKTMTLKREALATSSVSTEHPAAKKQRVTMGFQQKDPEVLLDIIHEDPAASLPKNLTNREYGSNSNEDSVCTTPLASSPVPPVLKKKASVSSTEPHRNGFRWFHVSCCQFTGIGEPSVGQYKSFVGLWSSSSCFRAEENYSSASNVDGVRSKP